jgi:hypothetical protein
LRAARGDAGGNQVGPDDLEDVYKDDAQVTVRNLTVW